MAKVTNDKLDKFRPQRRNANKHTQRGSGMLEASMRKYGYVAPMTAAANGEMIDGSDRLETSANVFDDEAIVIHHDGTKPIIMVRDDIPSADTKEAREISIAVNRIAQVNLDFDPEVLLEDSMAGIDLSGLWFEWELDKLTGIEGEGVDPAAEWQGMPEFEQESTGAIKTVSVHFGNEADLTKFAVVVGQTVTMETKSIWFPKKERENLDGYRMADES